MILEIAKWIVRYAEITTPKKLIVLQRSPL